MSPLQHKLQGLLDGAVADGSETGLQVAVYHHGKLVVDAWAGPPGPWTGPETLFPIFSTGKGIAATAILGLAQRGILDLDRPIAAYWPEFGTHGKARITLRHVLAHTAGLPMMPETGDARLAADWQAMCAFLAESSPLHAPGQRRHYHAITYGWLLGETARRADGRPIDRIIAEDIAKPLGISNSLFFGVPDAALDRCAEALKALPVPPDPNAPPPAPPDPVAARAIPPWVCPLEDWINQPVTRQACMPASNGFATARAIARHYAALIGDGVDGVRLLHAETLVEALRWTAADEAVGGGRKAGGFNLQGPDDAPGAVFGHGGYGGSNGYADRRTGIAVGFVKSRMGGPLAGQVFDHIRQCFPAS